MPPLPLHPTAAAARLIGISRCYLYQLTVREGLPHVHLRGDRRYCLRTLGEWVDAHADSKLAAYRMDGRWVGRRMTIYEKNRVRRYESGA